MPKWKLEDLKELVRQDKVWFSCPSRSVQKVIEVFASKGSPKSNEEASDYILEKLGSLTEDAYSTTIICFDQTCDVYGEYFDGVPWYIKFSLKDYDEEDCLNNLSFHPPEEDFETKSKRIEKWNKT